MAHPVQPQGPIVGVRHPKPGLPVCGWWMVRPYTLEVDRMRKGKDILGLPVITLDRASKVGVVKDLAIDPDRRRITALLLSAPDRRGPARRVPFEAVHRVGPDAVLIEDESSIVASERPERMTLVEGPAKLSGLQVLTDAGRAAGKVSDVLADERSGMIDQYEISTSRLQDLVSGRRQIPSSAPRAVGTEAMIVPESAVSDRAAQVREGPPLVLEPPSREFIGAPQEKVEDLAARLLTRQEELILGRRSEKTIANEDAGGVIVFEGETITEDTIQKAKAAGKLNLLVDASGEATAAALSQGLVEEYARVAVGHMAGRTVRTPEGEVVVSQGDVVTEGVVDRAREEGVLDQLAEAVQVWPEETVSRAASSRERARGLWDQIGERVAWLTGRR